MAVIEAIASVVGASVDDIDLEQLAVEHAHAEDFDEDLLAQLTPREQEVLAWVARGKATKEIATAMYVSESTVRKHLEHIFDKLDVTNRTAAIARLTGRA
jgi:DNA-binding NarL/FixJ family response regulator